MCWPVLQKDSNGIQKETSKNTKFCHILVAKTIDICEELGHYFEYSSVLARTKT